MLVEKIYIREFGKLKDFQMTFNSGLNTIVQNNSFGKSTLATFIKAMFYGFEYKKKNGVDWDIRMVAPWDVKGYFGGYIDFTHNGGNYRIERYFGSAGRYERGQLIDRNTGEVYSVAGVGKRIFGVDAQSFEQSLFIPQDTVQVTANSDFVSKLTNMVDGNKDQNNFDKAEKALTELSKEYKYLRGNGGQIFLTEQEIAHLTVELKQVRDAHYRLDASKTRLQLVDSSLNERTAELATINQQVQQLNQQIAVKSNSVDIKQQQSFNQASNYLATHSQTIVSDYDKALKLYQQKQSFVAPKMSPFVWLLMLLAVVGIVLAVAVQSLWYVGLAVALVGAVGTIVLSASFAKAKSRSQSQQRQVDSALHAIFIIHNVTGTTDEKLVALHKLKEDWSQQLTIYNTLKEVVAPTTDSSQESQQLADLVGKRDKVNDVINNLLQEKGGLEKQIEVLSQTKPEFEVQEALQNANQKLTELQQNYQAIQLTLQTLRNAKLSVSSNYLPPLTSKVAHLLKNVVDIQDVVVDKDFAIYLQENATTRKVQYFSRGIQELTAFCFRIALSQSVYGELPLLVVDDAFVNLDETNFAKAMQILKDLSQTTQVIYFSCHERSKTN